MIVLKRINNNAVLCIDPAGHQVVALGKGLAQCTVGKDVDLNLVDHTFYDVEPRYVELMRDLSLDYLEVSAQIVNVARGMLGYDLSPNIEVALADHIQFAIQRMREHIYLSAPLSYDLQQNYPLEYKIAQWSLGLIRQHFGVALPSNEISGIAMCLINGAYSSAGASSSDEAEKQDNLLEQTISLIESNMGASVNREGFGFARFATHLQYLIRRVPPATPYPLTTPRCTKWLQRTTGLSPRASTPLRLSSQAHIANHSPMKKNSTSFFTSTVSARAPM